ncbi:histone acetyltransferase [Dimargaris xerosporica]|nr:histone acetyltransferase [Dimargaris xerosporica]
MATSSLTYPHPDTPLEELDATARRLRIGRYLPCTACQQDPSKSSEAVACLGWHPQPNTTLTAPTGVGAQPLRTQSTASAAKLAPSTGNVSQSSPPPATRAVDNCPCGHPLEAHGSQLSTLAPDALQKCLEVATRLDCYLRDRGRLLDFTHHGDETEALLAQMRAMANAGSPQRASNTITATDDPHDESELLLSGQSGVHARDGDALEQLPSRKRLKGNSDEENSASYNDKAGDGSGTEHDDGLPPILPLGPGTRALAPQFDGMTVGPRFMATPPPDSPAYVQELMADIRNIKGKEKPAVQEERVGIIEFKVFTNDGSRESNILLTGVKNIFQKQLPKMPKEYIARLVYDRNHHSMAVVKNGDHVVGGITFRLFDHRRFAEIVFCAISSSEQVQGYGSHLMNHLKDYILGHTNARFFLTYADNYAIGYFKKQGFTKEITLDKSIWMGYIKDYEGGTIMQCSMIPRVRYLELNRVLEIQKRAIRHKIQAMSSSHIVYPGLTCFQAHANSTEGDQGGWSSAGATASGQQGSPPSTRSSRSMAMIDPYSIRGIKESGWTEEMDQQMRKPATSNIMAIQRRIVADLQNHNSSWSFAQPVNADEVPDYYAVIKEPMDLATLESNVEAEMYPTMKEFRIDTQKIFDNCRTYNAENTVYYKCACRLERYFKDKLKEYTSALTK